MITVRIKYAKCGLAKFISHLDLIRCLSRAFKRSGIPIWYTQGFNPRIYMMFSLPLPLGFEGEDESFDIKIYDDSYDINKIPEDMNAVLPGGIKIISADKPHEDPKQIEFADYEIKISEEIRPDTESLLKDFLDRESIVVTKRTKKGDMDMDIRPYLELLDIKSEGGYTIFHLRTAAGIFLNVNPMLLIDAFLKEYDCEETYYSIKRQRILNSVKKGWK